MTDYVWPEDLVPYGATFYLQPHRGGTESPFDRQSKIYLLSAPRWVCRMSFRGGYDGTEAQEAYGPRLDALISMLRGGANRVALYDFRRTALRGSDGGEGLTNQVAAAGDTGMIVGGFEPFALAFLPGDYVGGDGRPHIVESLTDIYADASGNATIAFAPPLSLDVDEGAAIYGKPTGMFRLTSEDAGVNTTQVGELAGYELEFTEDLMGAYLPHLSTPDANYYAVLSDQRLVSGSTMALARGIRNSDSVAVDLGASMTSIRRADIAALRGSGLNVKVDKRYDQSGNGRDFTQPTAAQRSILHEDSVINGIPAMTFPNVESNVARFSHLISPVMSLDREDFTLFLVIDPTASYKNQIYLRAETSAPLTNLALFSLSSGGAVDEGKATINLVTGGLQETHKYLQASPHVLTIRGTSGALDVWLDDIRVSRDNVASTIAKLYLGSDPTNSFYGNFRLGASIIVDKGVNEADLAGIWAVLRRRFRLSTTYDATLVYSGTSRTVAGQADNAFSKIYFELQQFAGNYRVINMGQDGQALSTTLANFANREATAYDPSRPWVLIVDDAINDLGGLGASSNPTNIYATKASLHAAAKALGPNVLTVNRTTLPQNSVGVYSRSSSAIEADRLTLNALDRTNSAGFDLVIDTAAIAGVGDPNDLTVYPDKLHMAALGNSRLGPGNAAPIDELLLS